jgi:hypothetical protein
MRKFMIVAGMVGTLALPASAQATDRQSASQECRFERGTTAATREAFKAKYGTNANKANAFGKCVSKATKDESSETAAAKANAPAACRAEQGTTAASQAAFTAKYGKGAKGKNAFGKCVSAKAKELKGHADAADHARATARRNAAKQCDEERGTTAATKAAFAKKYGKGAKGKNAFGKCVSKLAKAKKDDGHS